MTSPLTFPGTQAAQPPQIDQGRGGVGGNGRDGKRASAETVAPLGQTGAPTIQGDALPLGPLPGSRYPDSHLESAKKRRKPTFGPPDFPAFAGTMAVERVAHRFPLGRGTRLLPGRAYVLFSDIPNNRIMRFSEDDGHVSVFRQPSMNSNGNTIDREGRLLTCEHSGRRVTRTELDGSITIIADKYNGKKLNSPNDVVVASDGSIWFTDPGYGIGGYYEASRPSRSRTKHNVYRVDPKSGDIKVVVDDFVEPNGLAFSPDEKKLYVIDTGFTDGPDNPSHIRVFDVISAAESCRTARSLRRCPSPASPTACAPTATGVSGAPSAGAIRTRTACAATRRRRTARQDPHSGNRRQSLLRRPAAQPALHLRLDVALCGLHERAGRDEAVSEQCVVIAATRPRSVSPDARASNP